MKILLDTHALLWLISGDERLSKSAREIFLNTANLMYFSTASLWEICIKKSLEKISLKNDWLDIIQQEMKTNSIQWLTVEIDHCVKITDLPFHHRDPFDRMLIAQAMTEDLTILSRDSNFSAYDVKCVW
ncbi:MAG: type II toxin-antitoxin system VapC family toxin [Deltaproteobacteria bacterium]|nr:type II toxin-antitoxin system VapC family toxin [Deltaproteobacteria bacterium]